jgi:putative ABC transport system permease protein
MGVNPGYDPRNVLTLSLLPDLSHYDSSEKRLAYFDAVADRMSTIPGVQSAGYASTLPLSNPDSRRFYVREQTLPSVADVPHLDTYFVSPQYFETMRIPLLRGRLIGEQDRHGIAPAAVISETTARTQFAGEEPIGKHVQADSRDDGEQWATIVGVAGDVHQYGLDRPPDAAVYLAFAQATWPQPWARLVVRSTLQPERLESAVRAAMRSVDPLQPVFHLQPMDAYTAKSLAERTFTLELISVFGGLSLILAMVGIYGVVSCTVAMRTREVGVRMAIGAESSDVILMIMREVLATAAIGLAIGLGVSLLCARMLSNLLFGVKPTDVATIVTVATLILVVALAASYLPARRAARLDPLTALRFE